MEKSLFEQMGGTYTQVGDYLIPNLILPEQQEQPIGVWGQRTQLYLFGWDRGLRRIPPRQGLHFLVDAWWRENYRQLDES